MNKLIKRIVSFLSRTKEEMHSPLAPDEMYPDTGIVPGYPRWKQLVPEWPTDKQFLQAWLTIFSASFDKCKIVDIFKDDDNAGFTVVTPKRVFIYSAFIYHTDEPLTDKFIYEDGITWAVDKRGERYYYIDKSTGLPHDWNEAYNAEVIRRYLIIHGTKCLKQ